MSEPDLAYVAKELLAQVQDRLSAQEWNYASEYQPPMITAEADVDGAAVIVVNYAGSTRQVHWDGSSADAYAIVEGVAETLAEDISGDYWRTEGWRGRTRSE